MDQVKGEEGIPPPLLPSTWKVGWQEEEGATSWTLNLMVSSSFLPERAGGRASEGGGKWDFKLFVVLAIDAAVVGRTAKNLSQRQQELRKSGELHRTDCRSPSLKAESRRFRASAGKVS